MATQRQLISTPELLDQWYAEQKERHDNPGKHFLISTGLTSVDLMLGGGLGRMFFFVIGAPSKTGKTTWMLDMLKAAARQGVPAGWIGVEMGLVDTATIMVSSVSEVERDRIRRIVKNEHGEYVSNMKEEDWEQIKAAMKEMKDFPVYWNYGARTVKDIADAWVYCYKTYGIKLEMLFIDYLQLLSNPAKRTKTEEIESIATDMMLLKGQFIEEYDCPVCVVAASQINRASAREEIYDMQSLLHSSAIEHSANVIHVMSRVRDPENDELFLPNRRRIHNVAQRDTQTEDITHLDVGFNGAVGQFFDLEESEQLTLTGGNRWV